jgi:CheY-like chemotaxis protein
MTTPLIWIIDDDPIYRMIVCAMINQCLSGIETEEFETVEAAVERLAQNRITPNVVLLDINIPAAGGWFFLPPYESSLCLTGSTQLYICSSSINPLDIKRAKDHPCVADFIEKPLSDSFFQAIKQHLPKS